MSSPAGKTLVMVSLVVESDRLATVGNRFVGNVFSTPGSIPADAFNCFIGLEFCGGDGVSKGGDAKDTTAVGDHVLFVVLFGVIVFFAVFFWLKVRSFLRFVGIL